MYQHRFDVPILPTKGLGARMLFGGNSNPLGPTSLQLTPTEDLVSLTFSPPVSSKGIDFYQNTSINVTRDKQFSIAIWIPPDPTDIKYLYRYAASCLCENNSTFPHLCIAYHADSYDPDNLSWSSLLQTIPWNTAAGTTNSNYYATEGYFKEEFNYSQLKAASVIDEGGTARTGRMHKAMYLAIRFERYNSSGSIYADELRGSLALERILSPDPEILSQRY